MACIIEISNSDKTLRAHIAPFNGGMVTQIWVDNIPTLKFNDKNIDGAPFASGGMPLLFPFPSKTKDDLYQINGKAYHMPFHGLLKNEMFEIEEHESNRVLLSISSNEVWKRIAYPFDFVFYIEYKIENNTLYVNTRVKNNSQERMPHYFGIHPFFYTTDKKKIHIDHFYKGHYDYFQHIDDEVPDTSDLSGFLDDVFFDSSNGFFTLTNAKDGYRVKVGFDKVFKTMVLATWVEEAMCAEPWIGIPDGINQGRMIEWINPKEEKDYQCDFTFERIEEREGN